MNELLKYLEENPKTAGGLIGAPIGGLYGYMSADPNIEYPWKKAIVNALLGGMAGASIGHFVPKLK